jgi:hypothetical protein
MTENKADTVKKRCESKKKDSMLVCVCKHCKKSIFGYLKKDKKRKEQVSVKQHELIMCQNLQLESLKLQTDTKPIQGEKLKYLSGQRRVIIDLRAAFLGYGQCDQMRL